MWFLNKFSKDELQIIEENEAFSAVQKELENDLKVVESGNAEFINIKQLDEDLEATIRN